VQRALEVGALHRIIPGSELRAYLIDAVERGIRKTEESRVVKDREGRDAAVAEAA